MNRFEKFALDQHLNEYPAHWTFDMVLDCLCGKIPKDAGVVVDLFEPFRPYDPKLIAQWVRSTKASAEHIFG